MAIEVHPAVTLAVWWLSQEGVSTMRRDKGGSDEAAAARKDIAGAIGNVPQAALASDDALDAWAAWRMGRDFLTGQAEWVGDPVRGGYVLPCSTVTNELKYLDLSCSRLEVAAKGS